MRSSHLSCRYYTCTRFCKEFSTFCCEKVTARECIILKQGGKVYIPRKTFLQSNVSPQDQLLQSEVSPLGVPLDTLLCM